MPANTILLSFGVHFVLIRTSRKKERSWFSVINTKPTAADNFCSAKRPDYVQQGSCPGWHDAVFPSRINTLSASGLSGALGS